MTQSTTLVPDHFLSETRMVLVWCRPDFCPETLGFWFPEFDKYERINTSEYFYKGLCIFRLFKSVVENRLWQAEEAYRNFLVRTLVGGLI